ncbi:NAD(P)H-binding protein [Alloscardovia venturai]|uniref:NAD(P)H-binding protein n=1 Tax=Alloscardovia venturai TaxID=1769421 RepID=A0ABW2Y9G5_9BIFI
MKILVVGASGRVGASTVKKLELAGYDVIAGGHTRERVEELRSTHVQPVVVDVTRSTDELAAVLTSTKPDAVIFTAGSRGKNLLQVDAFGAVKMMQACEDTGIKRFVMLSTVGSLDPDLWDKPGFAQLKDYMTAKWFADQYLITCTSLDFTILQPVTLSEEPEAGLVQLGTYDFARPNSVHDVAAVLANLVEAHNVSHQIIVMSGGDIPVKDAVEAL